MRRLALVALAALALIIAGLVGLYLWREPIAAALAERYLARLGVPSSIRFERLDAHGLLARVRLGNPSRPDLTATVGASLAWQGLSPKLRTLTVSSALLRARFDGRRLQLGALERLTGVLPTRGTAARPGAATAASPIQITVEDARVLLDTPEGALRLDCTARLASGHLQAVSIELQPTTLRTAGLRTEISRGQLRATAQGAGWNARASLLARGALDTRSAALQATSVRLQINADDVMPHAAGLSSGPVAVRVSAQALSARLGTASPEMLRAGPLALSLHASGAQLAATAGGSAGIEGLDAMLHAHGLRYRLPAGEALAPSFEASARGTLSLRAGRPSADLQASAQFSGALSPPQLRAALRRLGLSQQDPRAAAALEQALRQFSVSAPQLRLLLQPGLLRIEAQAPVDVRAASGARLLLSSEADQPLLSAASGSESGALRLLLAGGGLPRLRVAIASYALGRDASGRPRASADLAVAANLSLPPLHGLSFSGAARVQRLGARYRIVLVRCAPIGLLALSPPVPNTPAGAGSATPAEISGLHLSLCPAPGPLLQGSAHAWTIQGLWRSLSVRAPAASVALAGGSGTVQATGTAGTLDTAALQISTLGLTDQTRPARFHALALAGAVTLAGSLWRGQLQFRPAASSQTLGTARLRYSPASAQGQVLLQVGPLTFVPGGLQPAELSPLLATLRDASGGVAFRGRLAIRRGALHSSGRLDLTNFGFTSAVGPVHQIDASIELPSLLPPRSAPAQRIRIGSIGSVASVTHVSARFQLLPEALRIEEATMQSTGGTVSLDPTTVPFSPKATINATVRVHDIDLNQLVAASSFASSIRLQVRVSGAIPFSVGPAGVRFRGGELASTTPGRLQIARSVWGPAAKPGGTNAFQDFAFQALSHLKVEQLSGALNSVPGGRLDLLLHIRGENDPPVPAAPRIGLIALLRGDAFNKPLPLPAGTPIDLTLDTSLNFDELLAALRPGSPTNH